MAHDEELSINILYDNRISTQVVHLHKPLLEAVFRGETTHGAHVEKLKNHDIYSVRTNEKGRILFTYTQINKKNHLVVLEILENHEYDKSRFLKSNVLKKYLEKNQPEFEAQVQDTDFEPSTILEHRLNDKRPIVFNSAFENNRGYIILDSEQEFVFSATTPMIVEGPPGSGKTSLAEGLVKQALNRNQSVLVVTRSTLLAKKIKADLSECPEYDPTRVDVCAYKELVPGLRDDGKDVFQKWFSQFLLEKIKDKDTVAKYTHRIADVYEEFRILSGYNPKDYTSPEGIGQKQSRFSEQKDRQWLAIVYQAFLKHLEMSQIRLSDFLILNPEDMKRYDLVVLDEAQDLSHLQLRNLAKITSNTAICLDRRQNIGDENPKIIYLKNMLTEIYERVPEVIALSTHYRCPQNIMEFAKVFNELRVQFSPKNKSEPKIAESPHHGGTVHWIDPKDKAQLTKLQQLKYDANACVITHERFKEEVIQKLGMIQVFTPEEIKGLEYKIVILYNMLNSDKLYQINELLKPGIKKILAEELNASAELSRCFVAATRPTEELLIIQANQHNLTHIIDKIKQKMQVNAPEQPVNKDAGSESPAEAWEARAKEAVERNNVDLAVSILKQHLKITDSDLLNKKILQWKGEIISDDSAAEVSSSPLVSAKQSSPQEAPKQPVKAKKPAAAKKGTTTQSVPKPPGLISIKELSLSGATLHDAILANKKVRNFITAAEKGVIKDITSFLEQNKKSVDQIPANGHHTALFAASSKGHTKVVQELLKAGANINFQDLKEQNTPLFVAALNGYKITFQTLLDAGAQFDLPNSYKSTTFLLAISKYENGFLDILLKKMGINYLFHNNSTTALITAVLQGKTKLVTKLLETEGIDVNARDSNGDTALHCAVWQRNVPLLEMLLKVDGIEVNAQNEKGETILHYAVLKEDIELLRMLLQVKDIKDLLNHDDETALSLAVEKKNSVAVEELLKIPQDLDASSGDDPILHAAVKNGSTEIVKLLLDAKADGESRNPAGGDSVLHLAVDYRHLETLNALIEAGINPNLQNIELETALHRSVFNDSLDEKKDTVSQQSIEMAKALLKAGIDPMLTDQDNCTALDYAHEAGNYGVIELLNPYFKTTKQVFSFFGSTATPKKDDESELLEGDVVFRNTQTG